MKKKKKEEGSTSRVEQQTKATMQTTTAIERERERIEMFSSVAFALFWV